MRLSRVFSLRLWSLLAVLASLSLGCDEPQHPVTALADPAEKAPPAAKKVEVAQNVFLEVQGDTRRVVLSCTVCLNKGPLEMFLTRKETKEHEAIVTVDADARQIHKALLLAKANPGSPVKFVPRYQAATGQPIKITVEWEEKNKLVSLDARQMIRNVNSKKPLEHNWVFCGSKLIPDPLDDKKVIFLANDGNLVCVSNFDDALLDLPIKSSKDAADLLWEANTEKIPPVGTKVTVTMEPLPDKKK
jgi:hypothetical protein